MIITHLKGDLGNQMSQYECGYSLANEYNSINKLDITYYSSIPSNHTKREFELQQFNISSKIYTIFTGIYPIEKYLGKKDLYLNGYFQKISLGYLI